MLVLFCLLDITVCQFFLGLEKVDSVTLLKTLVRFCIPKRVYVWSGPLDAFDISRNNPVKEAKDNTFVCFVELSSVF